jgi:hypothetical protein
VGWKTEQSQNLELSFTWSGWEQETCF